MIPAVLGLGSRYSYLAATRLPGIEDAHGVRFDWWPVFSPDLIRAAHGRSPFDAERLTGQYDPGYRDRDARRWAQLYDVPYHPPSEGLELKSLAETCWALEDPGRRRAFAWRVFQAIFAKGGSPGADWLAEQAAEVGSAECDGAAAHAAAIETCLSKGVFGVPSFLLGDEVFWGNDRLVLLRHRLERGNPHV